MDLGCVPVRSVDGGNHTTSGDNAAWLLVSISSADSCIDVFVRRLPPLAAKKNHPLSRRVILLRAVAYAEVGVSDCFRWSIIRLAC